MSTFACDSVIRPPSDMALIAQINGSLSIGGPRLIDLTDCEKITPRSIKYLKTCKNLRVLIYRGAQNYRKKITLPHATSIIDAVE